VGDAVTTRSRLTSGGSVETLHGSLDGPPNDLPSKACPRVATKLDELDPGRRRPETESCVDTSGKEVECTRSARFPKITQMKGNQTPDKQECMTR
jgi:hypothetical protein